MGSQIPSKQQFDSNHPSGDAAFSSARFRQNFQSLYAGDFLPFRPLAHDNPNMSIMVLGSDASGYQRGVYYGSNGQRIPLASGDTANLVKPSSNPRIDVVYITPSGDIRVEAGTEAASPSIPDISTSGDRLPVCAIYHRPTATKIVNFIDRASYTGDSYIMADLRPLYVIPRSDVATDTEAEVERNTKNIMLNRLRIQQDHALTVGQMFDGWTDDFQDSTGIATSTQISGDLLILGDRRRYSRNYAFQGTPNFNVIRSVSGSGGGGGGTPTLVRPDSIQSSYLRGYWKMSETSGTRADSSGYGNNLADNNTVTYGATDYWKTGEVCADFESGNSEYLSISDGSQSGLDVTGAISIAMWVKFESVGTTQYLLSKGTNYAIYLNSSTLRFVINGGSVDTVTSFVANRWYHVVLTHDDATNTTCWYVDGSLDNASTSQTENLTAGSSAFNIGANNGAQFLDGQIKDAAIWNTALTSLEARMLAHGISFSTFAYRPDRITDGLVSYWKMNEISSGAGAVTREDSYGNNDLTDNNTCTTGGGYHDGAAVTFNRNNSEYLSIAHGTQVGLSFNGAEQSFSIAAWFRPWESSSVTYPIVSKINGTTDGYWLGKNSSGQLEGRVYRGSSGATVTSTFTFPEPGTTKRTWYHVAMVYDATANTLKLYIDGQEAASGAQSAGVGNAAVTFYSGYDGSNNASMELQDLAIWNTAISTSAIQSLASGLPVITQGWAAYWKCDETSGTLTDALGNNDMSQNGGVIPNGTGKVGNGRDLEASSSQYFNISDVAQTGLNITDDMTVLSWLKRESTGAEQVVIQKGYSASGWYLLAAADSKLRFGSGASASDGNTTMSSGVWYHGTGVWDGAQRKVYIDGTVETLESGSVPQSNSESAIVGAMGTPANFFDGILDEIIVSKRWLRPDEIKAIRNRGYNAKTANGTEITVSGGGDGGAGGDGKAVVVCGKQAFDFLATKATMIVVSKNSTQITAELSRNSGDTWNSMGLTLDFYDGTYYYQSAVNDSLAGSYPAGTGDYYVTFVIPSGGTATLEGYGVALA